MRPQGELKMTIVRAAVVQDSPIVFNRDATIEKVHSLVNQAARKGTQLVVIPEAFVSAYPSGLDFGARLGLRTPKGRDDFRRYYESAVEVPGPACDALGKAARESGVFLVIGVIERDGGTLYCTVLFFSPDGRLMGKHRKLMPTAMERLVWGFGDGSTMPVFDTPLVRSELSSAGKITCPCFECTCTARESNSIVPQRPTIGTPGYQRCVTSPWRDAVLS